MSTQPKSTRKWWALALIAAAQFMVIMDTSIIGVALPQMQSDLGFSQEGLTWVFNAYVIAFGGLLLLGGRLSDLFGARRVFSAGWLILLIGSVVAGAAGNVAVELAGRAVQGAGAALIAPSALTLLMMLFGSTQKEMTKALSIYGAAAPAGGTAGVFLGGVITEYTSWPWVFYLNIPIAVIALIATPLLMPNAPARTGSIDFLGALAVTAGLAVGVFGIVRAPDVGWGSGQTWLALAVSAALLGAFVLIQSKRREPLVRLGIFKAPNLGAANIAQLVLGAAWIPMWFFLNLYLQQVLGYSAFPAGAALLPMTIFVMLGMVVVAPRAMARFGAKAMIVAGLLVLGIGLGWMSLIRPTGNFWVDVLPASLVAAAGMTLAFIPSLGTAISAARPEEGGLASGIVNVSYQVGSAVGLAVMTAIAAVFGADQLGDLTELTNGFSAVFLGAAAIAVVGAAITAVVMRSTKVDDPRTVQSTVNS
ncbi:MULTISPECIES: MFS transporter [Rhodococcus]|jgi:EmrB/QacA subfamily drug resistance transporter|uniref:MFS transporter n=1 Tax=Rhodococcus TaxID=1827 RepID=UPI000303649D|nr:MULTISPECIES: MFS transporter [Rhodococcus]AZI60182.1 MFS transporter [Rhodococcus sp. NJ-530]MCW0192463.1 MFS transporter [Rhodococcus sp. (in: high G+C Gram-positive bacteria)]MCZ4618165.1 MFS transporter [Rhodococcus qingshengii]BDQ18124.1 MFS transporter [Rhodococcus qingshengii]